MDSSRFKYQRSIGYKPPLESRFYKWIETGRQVFDGVAGTRPGVRRNSSRRLQGRVTKWVGEKLDWFLEDEDDWLEPWQSDSSVTFKNKKKPLDAISMRVQKSIPSSQRIDEENFDENHWPDDSSFRVNKWQRPKKNTNSAPSVGNSRDNVNLDRRNLPRSSRRR